LLLRPSSRKLNSMITSEDLIHKDINGGIRHPHVRDQAHLL
jgi:hypothetical protein